METTKKPDRRIAKSKSAIKNAFVKLMSKKDINNITIKDIADLADVDRKTVYNYYKGSYEILNEIEDELVTTITEAVKSVDFEPTQTSAMKIFEKISDAISSNVEFYSNLMRIDSKSQLVKKMIVCLNSQTKETLLKQNVSSSTDIDTLSTFITAGVLNAYYKWFNSDRQISISDFSKQVAELVVKLIS